MSPWPDQSGYERTSFGGLSRSELMSRIRSKHNATTELKSISLFRSFGVRGWRRGVKLPGKPDFVFPKSRLVVFVDGCFWHGHNCGRNLKPKRNVKLWHEKIANNQRRDRRNARILRAAGWRVFRVWECKLSKNPLTCVERIERALNLSKTTTRNGLTAFEAQLNSVMIPGNHAKELLSEEGASLHETLESKSKKRFDQSKCTKWMDKVYGKGRTFKIVDRLLSEDRGD